MAVYVDKIQPCRPTADWPYNYFCRMVADTDPELHAMARRLFLKLSWYRYDRRPPHYELTYRKRKEAIDAGAIEITGRKLKSILEGTNAADEPSG